MAGVNTVREQLRLTDLLPGKGVILELWTENAKLLQDFKEASYTLLGRDTQWFHQCDSAQYHMFEFWVAPHKLPLVIERCEAVAKKIGKDLVNEL